LRSVQTERNFGSSGRFDHNSEQQLATKESSHLGFTSGWLRRVNYDLGVGGKFPVLMLFESLFPVQ
jgi:hypothetical protein